jgi:hypothetical protein
MSTASTNRCFRSINQGQKKNRFWDQGCQIFLDKWYQNRKNVPNEYKMYKMVKNIPNLRKIFQMDMIYLHFPIQGKFENKPSGNPVWDLVLLDFCLFCSYRLMEMIFWHEIDICKNFLKNNKNNLARVIAQNHLTDSWAWVNLTIWCWWWLHPVSTTRTGFELSSCRRLSPTWQHPGPNPTTDRPLFPLNHLCTKQPPFCLNGVVQNISEYVSQTGWANEFVKKSPKM